MVSIGPETMEVEYKNSLKLELDGLIRGKSVDVECIYVSFIFFSKFQGANDVARLKQKLDFLNDSFIKETTTFPKKEPREGEEKISEALFNAIELVKSLEGRRDDSCCMSWTTTLKDVVCKIARTSILLSILQKSFNDRDLINLEASKSCTERDFYNEQKDVNYIDRLGFNTIQTYQLDPLDEVEKTKDGEDHVYYVYNKGQKQAEFRFSSRAFEEKGARLSKKKYMEKRTFYVELSAEDYSSNAIKLLLSVLEGRSEEIRSKVSNLDKIKAIDLASYLGILPLVSNHPTNISYKINSTASGRILRNISLEDYL